MRIRKSPLGVEVQLEDGGTLPIRQIIGIGMNYAAHAAEQGKGVPERPVFFTKNVLSACLSGDDIVIPKVCQDRPQVDFEAELGVIVGAGPGGRPARDIPESAALSYVLGYVAANDVSARWWQKEGSGGQFFRGKSFDTFCPLSEIVTPAASIADPQSLRLTAKVNGALMQDASTSDMVFSVARLIAELSRGITIPSGTLILTGTPSGVGMSQTPPVFLKAGDVVEIEVAGVGALRNTVRME